MPLFLHPFSRYQGYFFLFAMASGTDEKAKMESLTSPAAFVEGGVQDACDDACSICLEAFCESDPSTVSCHFFNSVILFAQRSASNRFVTISYFPVDRLQT